MENIEAEGTACHHYGRGSYVVASRRLAGGQHTMSIEAWSNACHHRTRAAGRAVSHGEH